MIEGRWAGVIILGTLLAILLIVTGAQINSNVEVSEWKVHYLQERDALLHVIDKQIAALDASTLALDAAAAAIREVSHIDYMLNMGNQLESVRERLVTDFRLDQNIPEMGIGGECERN